ncbi:hypothetical protein D9M68_189360 [compost metagenome]|uniref:hypothetical protein n=1 Tax=Pseudomonas fluorescens TaxID=294 RepID=UPI001240AFB1|nr:hypothetical protein [Pseudomonas fluorescens]VVQ23641.1 hypothetical protein PS934_05540 [Pseudomonas fluorescens]
MNLILEGAEIYPHHPIRAALEPDELSDFEYAGKRKQTRRERFLAEMDQIVSCSGLLALIEPYYPKAGSGRKPAQATG